MGFGLAWLLREVPLRTTAGAMAGVSKSFGMDNAGAAAVQQEIWARARAARAALTRLDEAASDGTVPPALIERLRAHYEARLARIEKHGRLRENASEDLPPAFWDLTRDLLETERRELLRGDDDVDPSVAHRMQDDLDGEEADMGAGTPAAAG